jgi:hypothetical protein
MPANRFNGFTEYGTGIGLRIPHYAHIFEKKPAVDWFEIISENYMVDGGRPLATLDLILERYRVVQHGGEQASMLEQWFAAWAELGWLCAPAQAGKKKRRISEL